MKTASTLVAALMLLTACSSNPPPPEWKASAFSALHEFSSAHLGGNTRLADLEFDRARSEISRTGRLDLMARAELTRCAVQVASLERAIFRLGVKVPWTQMGTTIKRVSA